MQTENNAYIFRLRIHSPNEDWEIILTTGNKILGREEGVDIRLADPYVSRQHARLTVGSVECVLMDLGSHNGTWVDGQPLEPNQPVILRAPAVIRIDPFVLTFDAVPVSLPEVDPLIVDHLDQPEPLPAVLPPPDGKDDPLPALVDQPVDVAQPADEQPEGERARKAKIDISYPPGLNADSVRLLSYLPAIYHTEFMSHFMALFESILLPVEWTVDNFDLYLNPETAPASFLPWLANWFEIAADPGWQEAQRRDIFNEAAQLYARRGTRWAMSRVLEILTGQPPEIIEFEDGQPPFTFTVRLQTNGRAVDYGLAQRLIAASKPAHMHCILVTA